MVKNLPAMQEAQIRSLGQEDSLGEGSVYRLQYPCLENSLDRGAWKATVHGVAKSQTWLSDYHFHVQEENVGRNHRTVLLWKELHRGNSRNLKRIPIQKSGEHNQLKCVCEESAQGQGEPAVENRSQSSEHTAPGMVPASSSQRGHLLVHGHGAEYPDRFATVEEKNSL